MPVSDFLGFAGLNLYCLYMKKNLRKKVEMRD